MLRWNALVFVMLLFLQAFCLQSAHAYEAEDSLKVAIIAKLAKFVRGSERANDNFVIAILHNPFGELPNTLLVGKNIHNSPVVVHYIDSLANLGAAQVLFIPKMSPSKMHDVLASIRGRKILTISDSRAFAQLGGMIQVYTASRRLKLKINLGVTRQAGLRIRSSLLKIAEIVGKEK